jgi:UDP-glucose 4-epimerase
MRILVVGASGFLGRAVCAELLREGHAVHGTWRKHPERLRAGLEGAFSEGDLEISRTDFEVVVACSALVPYGAMNKPDPALIEANVEVPRRLTSRFPEARIVLASSVAVYGDAPSPRTEGSPFASPSEYGWSKLAAEAMIRQHPSFGIIRFSSLYGPGMKEQTFLPAILRSAHRERKISLFGDGSRRQDYLHVADAARLVRLVCDRQGNGTFLGASGESVSNLEVANLIAQELEGATIQFLGVDVAPSISYDVGFTRQITGFVPAISIGEGIRSLVVA